MPPSGVLRAHAGARGRVHFALALLAFGLPLSLGLLSCVGHIFTLCPDRYLLCPCSPVSFLSSASLVLMPMHTRSRDAGEDPDNGEQDL